MDARFSALGWVTDARGDVTYVFTVELALLVLARYKYLSLHVLLLANVGISAEWYNYVFRNILTDLHVTFYFLKTRYEIIIHVQYKHLIDIMF